MNLTAFKQVPETLEGDSCVLKSMPVSISLIKELVKDLQILLLTRGVKKYLSENCIIFTIFCGVLLFKNARSTQAFHLLADTDDVIAPLVFHTN